MPGFVAAVNSSVVLPDSVQELYLTNYLYGFFSSGIIFAALHFVFPAREVDAFVKNELSAVEVQRYYSERWDVDLLQSQHMAMPEGRYEKRREYRENMENGENRETRENGGEGRSEE